MVLSLYALAFSVFNNGGSTLVMHKRYCLQRSLFTPPGSFAQLSTQNDPEDNMCEWVYPLEEQCAASDIKCVILLDFQVGGW